MKINFVGIGASRSGSSWLGECLREHPEVDFSKVKELNFFNKKEAFQLNTEYLSDFLNFDKKISGEFTPKYFMSSVTMERIYKYNPEIKLIAILRNPVDRAYSEFLYNKAREHETEETFEEALRGPNRNRYLNRGLYFKQLEPVFKLFKTSQIHVCMFEDIKRQPEILLRDLFKFLAVDQNFKPSLTKTVINGSNGGHSINKIPYLNKILGAGARKISNYPKIRSVAKMMCVGAIVQTIEKRNTVHTAGHVPKEMLEKTRAELRVFYAGDIKKLSKLTGINLDHWLN